MLATPSPARSSRSRFARRAEVVARALLLREPRRGAPVAPRRILVAHHLLLGDTLMLTPLLKKLRECHPHADIAMTVATKIAPIYATKPYGVRALPFDPRAAQASLFAEAPFDLAVVPGDNRYAWLAAAMRARFIVAFAGDRPAPKSWPVDALVPYPDRPATWGDLVAQLVDGPSPAPFRNDEWHAPPFESFDAPRGAYVVLHVGASSPLKQWPPARWREVADRLARRGVTPVWSAAATESGLVDAADPSHRYPSFAGRLDLAQLWHLVQNATLLVAPDTGIAHLGRIVGVPTVALFGPGSAILCGAGDFWRDAPYRAVTIDPFPCRDQRVLFKREVAWVRRCGRSVGECPKHLCMPAIQVDAVLSAIDALIEEAE
ncbi:MAG TPA: glycosyltransferase family 9 protein [Casimicrobiaceae bacterium]|nr:glycosyltransferase family 9 protein [Casimicrobiaceae bacterium]